MKIGIMQPYFFPYMGYWQLINCVDKYVIYDDVNFINRGWINRNRILINGQSQYFNLPMIGASQNKLINEIEVNTDSQVMGKKMRMLELAYKKAPYYKTVYPIICQIMNCGKRNMAKFLAYSIYVICDYLEIETEIIISSQIDKDNSLKGQDKILDICKILDGNEYYNAIGGRELYSYEAFERYNIKLAFIQTNNIKYKQFDNAFQAGLSIIDVMMFNSVQSIKNMLDDYKIIAS